MVHGAPDNFEVQQKSLTYRLDDMSELAVRLGGLSSIDRLGEVLLYEDFTEDLGKGSIYLSGLGSEGIISGDKFRSGGFSLKLTTGSDFQVSARYSIRTPNPTLSKYGFECWFYIDSYIDNCQLWIYYYDGAKSNNYGILFDVANKKIKIYDSDGAWQEIDSSFKYASISQPFICAKFVVDLNTGYYKRLKLLNTSYNLSDYSVNKTGSTTVNHLSVSFVLYSRVGHNGIIYIDNMIITQNEP